MGLKENNDETTREHLYQEIKLCKERFAILEDINDLKGGVLVTLERGRLMQQIQDAMIELVKLIG